MGNKHQVLTLLSSLLILVLVGLPVFAENGLQSRQQYVDNMLVGSLTDNERMIMDNKVRLEKLPKPAKGEKKAARKANNEALALIKAEAFEKAVPLLAKAHQLDPSDIEILNNYGFVLMKSRQLDKAWFALADALAMKPDRASGWRNFADVLALQGKIDSAVAGYMNAYRFSKNREKTHQLFQNLQLNEDSPYVHEAIKKATEKATRLFFSSPSSDTHESGLSNIHPQNSISQYQSDNQQPIHIQQPLENTQSTTNESLIRVVIISFEVLSCIAIFFTFKKVRKHLVLVVITIWIVGGFISLWLGFPVCVTPGHEKSFIMPMAEIKQAFSDFGLPLAWIPSKQNLIIKDKLNGIDGVINAFAYYEGFLLGLILMLPKITPFFSEMFSGGWWPILRGILEIAVIFLGLVSAIAVLGFGLLSQTSSIDYKIVFFVATLPALAVVMAAALLIFGMFSMFLGGASVNSGGGAGAGEREDEAQTGSTDSHNDVLVGMQKAGNFYKGSNWLTEELAGRVDEEGNIYKGSNWITEEKVGRIDKDGNIYKGSNWFTEEKTGRIDRDGNIHKGSNWLTEEKTGRIDEEGNVYKGSNWLTEEKIGRVEKKDK